MGPKGTIRAARKFLAEEVSLAKIGASGRRFPKLLDRLTSKFVRKLPRGARNWGAARKFLNIYLRDAAYNVYLRKAFRLDRIERQLEVPIDRQVAEALIAEDRKLRRNSLPRWKSVISLSPEDNIKYQTAVKEFASKEGIDTIHFNVIAWRKRSGYL
jgi:hypothetical protein